jgi:undecaprenyl-diphosphatase
LRVVVNAAAGPRAHDDVVAAVREALPDATIDEVDDGDEIPSALEAAAKACSTLGVVGGDGTINQAAAIALDHDVALAVFPGGTLNHFARDLGISSAEDTIAAVRHGRLVRIDTASIDGRFFLNTASFGSYSAFVRSRTGLEDRIGKWPATLVALVRTLRRGERFDLELDGEPMKVWMAFIGNGAYDPPGFAPATRARLDDGLLDIRLVDGSAPGARLRLAMAVLTGSVANSSAYVRRTVASARITTSRRHTTLAADGEIFEGHGDFSIEKQLRSLKVHVPAR